MDESDGSGIRVPATRTAAIEIMARENNMCDDHFIESQIYSLFDNPQKVSKFASYHT